MTARRCRIGFCLLALTLLLSSCPGKSAGPKQGPKPAPSTPVAPLSGTAQVLYVVPGPFPPGSPVWLYDTAGDRLTQLSVGPGEVSPEAPRFVGTNEIMYLRDGTISRAPIVGSREPASFPRVGPVSAFAWNARLGILAYVAQRPVDRSGAGPDDVFFLTPNNGRKRLVKRFFPDAKPASEEEEHGDGPDVDDEKSLTWSPDGTKILLVDTHMAVDGEKSVYVFGKDGRVIASQRDATHAVWAPDSASVYFLRWRTGMEGTVQPVQWFSLALKTGRLSELSIKAGRMHPTLSPDGRFLALDDGAPWIPETIGQACTCTIFLYNLKTGIEREIVNGFVAPRWVSSNVLLASSVRECRVSECGSNTPAWIAENETSFISIADGRTSRAAARSTLDADVRFP